MSFKAAVKKLQVQGSDTSTLADIIRYAGTADDESVAFLAQVLAESGKVVGLRTGTCDLASTGGPSSLSTLLCPVLLKALGYIVPKVGVPGRPAGAIDVLATIPGYKVEMSHSEFESTLAAVGFCHAIAGNDLAPFDSELFLLRKHLNAVDVAPLVIASLLSKKIAVGLEKVVLDVRVWRHGNFGRNRPEARTRANRYCRVSAILGIHTTCVLTDASRPYQPFIGRGESLLALDIALYGLADSWLKRHIDLCFHMAACLSTQSVPRPSRKQLQEVFEKHLVAQGSSQSSYHKRVAEIASEATTIVHSQQSGFVAIDIEHLRKTIVNRQTSQQTGDQYSDPVGVRLLVESGSYVEQGTPVAAIRHNDGRNLTKSMEEIGEAFSFAPVPPRPQWHAEIIRSGT